MQIGLFALNVENLGCYVVPLKCDRKLKRPLRKFLTMPYVLKTHPIDAFCGQGA